MIKNIEFPNGEIIHATEEVKIDIVKEHDVWWFHVTGPYDLMVNMSACKLYEKEKKDVH